MSYVSSYLASLLTVEEVALWATHSMHMPADVVQVFMNHSVTGFDFPELIENNGELIETELGVTRRNLKKRLLRGMIMRFTGMGKLPQAPGKLNVVQSGCNQIQVQWDRVGSNGFPVHKYLVQRLQLDSAQTGAMSSKTNKWETVYEDTGDHFIDSFAVGSASASNTVGALYRTYRLSAWNVIGRSEYVTVYHFLPPFEGNCHKSNSSPSTAVPRDESQYDNGLKNQNVTASPVSYEELESIAVSISVGILLALGAYLFTQSSQKTASKPSSSKTEKKESKKKAANSIALVVKLKSLFYRRRKRRQNAGADILKTDSEISADMSSADAFSRDSAGEPLSPVTEISVEDLSYTMSPSSPDNSVVSSSTKFADGTGAAEDGSLPPLHPKKRSNWKVLKEHIRNGTLIDAMTKPRSRANSNGSMGSNGNANNTTASANSPPSSPSNSSVRKFILPPSPLRLMKSKSNPSETSSSQVGSPDSNASVSSSVPTRSMSFGALLDQLGNPSNLEVNTKKSSGPADDSELNANISIAMKISPRKLLDGTHCHHCGRSYTFVLLKKHQCGRCQLDFCQDCSFSTPHSALLPCKVPSLCICKSCGK